MKKLGIVVLLMALFATSVACAGVIDASNSGANWTVLSGNDLDVSIFLTNGPDDNAKISCDLELVLSGVGTLPTFQSINMAPAGGIFAGGAQGLAKGLGGSDVYRHVDVNTATSNEGVLANLVIDTTGVAPGIYNFTPVLDAGGTFSGTELIDEMADPIAFTRVAGTITVVPEPSTVVLGGIAALALLAFRRVRRSR